MVQAGNFQNRNYPIMPGMRVFVYRNLNARAYHPVTYSLQARKTVDIAGYTRLRWGAVFHHSASVLLRDCELIVKEGGEGSRSGWRSVRHEGRKNVHAGIIGTLVSWSDIGTPSGCRVHYNPYRNTTFVDDDGVQVTHADHVWCSSYQDGGRHRSAVWASGVQTLLFDKL